MIKLLNAVPEIDLFQYFKPFVWLIPLFVFFYVAKVVLASPVFKGWLGEKILHVFTLKKLNPNEYKILSDIYLPRPDGEGTTQIDHILVSQFGIFVIETKNYRNWIFGGEKQRKWTQQIYRTKNLFQNPIHQNMLHIKALALFLDVDDVFFHNLVFFVGNCEFKTEMPEYVKNKGFRKYIESYKTSILSQEQVEHVYITLLNYDKNLNRKKVAKEHMKSIKARLGKQTSSR